MAAYVLPALAGSKFGVAKMLGVAAIAAACFVPAGLVARQHQVRLHAFTTQGPPAAIGERFAALVPPAQRPPVQLDPVLVTGVIRTRDARDAAVPNAGPPPCQGWRALDVGPSTRSAAAPSVRECDGAIEGRSASAPTATGRDTTKLAPARPPPRRSYDYEFRIGAPR